MTTHKLKSIDELLGKVCIHKKDNSYCEMCDEYTGRYNAQTYNCPYYRISTTLNKRQIERIKDTIRNFNDNYVNEVQRHD